MSIKEGTPDDRYFEWLYAQVAPIRNRNPARTYWKLFRRLYVTKFEFYVRNDENRAKDGIELRYEFFGEEDLGSENRDWRNLDCSFLEMLVALARRAAFQTDDEPGDWFWKLLENLELRKYTDAVYTATIDREVGKTLDNVNKRRYSEDGVGGLFPLRYAETDQRRVEVWYQLAEYLLEGGY